MLLKVGTKFEALISHSVVTLPCQIPQCSVHFKLACLASSITVLLTAVEIYLKAGVAYQRNLFRESKCRPVLPFDQDGREADFPACTSQNRVISFSKKHV